MTVLDLYVLPRGYSKKFPQLTMQIILNNIVNNREYPDESNLFRYSTSYDTYINKEGRVILEPQLSYVDNPLEYTKEKVSLQEGILDDRIIETMMSLSHRLRVSKIVYTHNEDEFTGVLPSVFFGHFLSSVLQSFFSKEAILPEITDELIQEVNDAMKRSDMDKICLDTVAIAQNRVFKFLTKHQGKEYFLMVNSVGENEQEE